MAAFTWGDGGTQDPQGRRRLAEALIQQGTDASPVRHWTQGLARVAQALTGSLIQNQEDDRAQEGAKMLLSNPAFGGAVAGPAVAGGPAPTEAPVADPTQPRGIRNNNPGNIEDGPFAQKMPGYVGSDGRFAKFEKPEHGATAMDTLLASYGSRGINTIGGVVNRWAPPSDNNPTSAYAATVAKGMGLDPSAPIDLSDPSTRAKLAAGMAQFENGRPVQMAQAGGGMPVREVAPGAATQPATTAQPATRTAPQLPPAVADYVKRLIANPYTRAAGIQMLGQWSAPRDQWSTEKNADGSIYQRNALTGEMKAVEKSDVLPEAAVDQKVRIATAGKPVTTIDQRAPDEFEKEYGQGMGKRALDVIAQGDAASTDLQNSALSRSFLTKVQTGALAGPQATVGAWAKAVGIDPAKLGIDPNLPAIDQAAASAINQNTIGMIGSGGFPSNNFSNTDLKFLQSVPAKIGNTPEANELLHDIRDRVAQRKVDRANAWSEARDNKVSYEKFESGWRKKVAAEDMFADVRAKVDAMQGGGFQTIDGVQIRKKN